MVVIRSEAGLGRAVWTLLHIIAANFPDGAARGLTQQRLRGYFDFLSSLGHVLPRASWREMWRRVTAVGTTELDWKSFKTVRDHRELSQWLFAVHDAVRHQLSQKKAGSYAKLYATYRKYRENAKINAKNRAEDPTGLQKLRVLLQSRTRAMNEYLEHRYGDDFAGWTSARKAAMRKSHLDQAAMWYWDTISNRASRVDVSFDDLSVVQRRDRVLKHFDFNYRLRPQRIMNAVVSLPGNIKNKILG